MVRRVVLLLLLLLTQFEFILILPLLFKPPNTGNSSRGREVLSTSRTLSLITEIKSLCKSEFGGKIPEIL